MINFKNYIRSGLIAGNIFLASVGVGFAQDAGSTKSGAAGTEIDQKEPTKREADEHFTREFLRTMYGLKDNTQVSTDDKALEDIQRRFDDRYSSVSKDDLLVKYYWENLNDKDVQKGALEYLNKHLYSNSGGNIILDNKFYPGVFRRINGDYWLSTLQVGDGNGYFNKEWSQSKATTWANTSDLMGLSVDESREIVKVNEGVSDAAITTLLFPNGYIYDHVASDGASKEGTMNQKINSPISVYTYNWQTGKTGSEVTVLNESSDGHYIWERGSIGWLPIKGLFEITGTDIEELNKYLEHLDQNYADFQYVSILLDDMTSQRDDMDEWAIHFANLYLDEYEAHEHTKANWRGGFQLNAEVPTDNISGSKPLYSVEGFTTMPFIGNNSIKFGMGYTFMPNSSMTRPLEVTDYYEERSGNPIFGETIGFTQEEKGGPTDITQHKIYGTLGIHLGNNWFVTGRGGVQRLEFNENTYTTTGFKNDAGEEWDVNRTLAKTTTVNENQPFAGISIDKLFGPVGVSGGVNYNFTTTNTTLHGGVLVDLGYFTK